MNKQLTFTWLICAMVIPSCKTQPPSNNNLPSSKGNADHIPLNSFVFTFNNGNTFRFTPNMDKLRKDIKSFSNTAHSDIYQEFQERVILSVHLECNHNPNPVVEHVVFYKYFCRNENGASFVVPFKIGDYAIVDELK